MWFDVIPAFWWPAADLFLAPFRISVSGPEFLCGFAVLWTRARRSRWELATIKTLARPLRPVHAGAPRPGRAPISLVQSIWSEVPDIFVGRGLISRSGAQGTSLPSVKPWSESLALRPVHSGAKRSEGSANSFFRAVSEGIAPVIAVVESFPALLEESGSGRSAILWSELLRRTVEAGSHARPLP